MQLISVALCRGNVVTFGIYTFRLSLDWAKLFAFSPIIQGELAWKVTKIDAGWWAFCKTTVPVVARR